MEFLRLTPDIAGEWDGVIHNSDDGWIFSLFAWLQMVTSVWQIENHSFAISENGKVVAVMPLHLTSNGTQLASGGWGHGGPTIVSGISDTDRRRLWRACLAHTREIAVQTHAKRIMISISPLNQTSLNNQRGVNPLLGEGIEDVSTHSRIIDLSQIESDLWFGLSQDARQQIKKARAAGYSVQKRPWPEMVEEYYRVHKETYHRTGVNPHPKAYFEGIATQLGGQDHAVLWVGLDPQGRPVAFHNDARFGNTAMYHTGCSETAHLKSGINYLLFWEAILGAKADRCLWYESGEVFPQATSGKDRGLTVFKSKFGGELRRLFRAEIVLDGQNDTTRVTTKPRFRSLARNWLRATRDLLSPLLGRRLTKVLQRVFFKACSIGKSLQRSTGARRSNETMANQTPEAIVARTRLLYSQNGVYKVDTVNHLPSATSTAYTDVLLRIRLDIVRQFASQATLLDLCCATGQHLVSFADRMKHGVGVDFSLPYVQKARVNKSSDGGNHADFICGNVKILPFRAHYFDLIYSFSSLYQIPNVGEVIYEISRILKPGGKCVLDLGNLYSLNLIVSKAHPELPQPCYIPVGTMKRLLQEAGLVIIQHRAFQILPLWADRPLWLKPLLWPGWKRLLEKQIKGKMLDEWISNLPGLKLFAFRHVFVCEKR